MSSVVVRLTNGTTRTLVAGTDYTVSTTGTSTPTFTLTPTYVVAVGGPA